MNRILRYNFISYLELELIKLVKQIRKFKIFKLPTNLNHIWSLDSVFQDPTKETLLKCNFFTIEIEKNALRTSFKVAI